MYLLILNQLLIALKEMLFKAMKKFGIPAKLVRLIKATLKTVKYKAKVQYDLSVSLKTH
jgi:hypothetical protein